MAPIEPIDWLSKIGFQTVPASDVFQMPPLTAPKATKTFQIRKTQKTDQSMNNAIQFEDRVSGSRSRPEGESSAEVCDRLSPDSRE